MVQKPPRSSTKSKSIQASRGLMNMFLCVIKGGGAATYEWAIKSKSELQSKRAAQAASEALTHKGKGRWAGRINFQDTL